MGVFFGPLAGAIGAGIVDPSADVALGRASEVHLTLWHGFNPTLALSLLTLAAGAGLARVRLPARRWMSRISAASPLAAERAYDLAVAQMNALARFQTRLLQSGYLRSYQMMILTTAVGLGGWVLASQTVFAVDWRGFSIHFYEAGVAIMILAAAVAVVRSDSRLAAIAALGVVGYGVALLYVLFGAPDLAMTQILVETLTVILFVLVFYHLPRFASFSTPRARARDLGVALLVGGFVTALVLAATATPGVGCLMAAIAVHFGDLGITTRAMAVVLFTFLTAPVAAHMIARVAYFIGEPLWKGTVVDELRGCYDQRTNVCRSAPVEGGGAAARAVPTNNS